MNASSECQALADVGPARIELTRTVEDLFIVVCRCEEDEEMRALRKRSVA